MIEDKFMEYANSLPSGYIKAWKAYGMIRTFREIVNLGDDKTRTLKWVKNCLEMEGFWPSHCELINEWLWENVK